MTSRNKHPGSALQRATGAGLEIQMHENSLPHTYATQGELQSRHLMKRCGIERRQASLIAALFFGEGRR